MHIGKVFGFLTIFISIMSVATTGVSRDWKASCPRLPDDSVQAQLSAGQLFDAAEKNYRAGHPVEALTSFLCSFQIVQHENTVFNIAQIAKLSQNRDVYLDLLKDFVANTNGSVKVDPIREIIAELDSSYKYETSGEDKLETAPSEEEIVSVPPESIPAPDSSPSPASTTEKKRRGMMVAGWAVFGAGAASAAAGGVLQGLAASTQKEATAQDTLADFTAAESKMNNLQVGAIAGFAVGGALITTGLVLVLVSKKGRDSASVAVLPTVGGFSIAGRF